ncbi:MAG: hypothetical protein R3Y60_01890 [bacterium]
MDKEIAIKFSVDTSSIDKAMADIRTKIKSTNDELKKLGSSMNTSTITNAQKEIDQISTKSKQAQKEVQNIGKNVNTTGIKTATKSMDTLATNSKSATETISSNFNKMYSSIATGFRLLMFTYIGRMIVKAISYIFTQASDMAEIENLFEVSLGNMASAAEEFALKLNNAWGVSATTIKNYVATLNNMYSSMGISTDTAFGMSTAITELSYNIASLYNISSDDALEKFKSATLGISRPMKELGIVTNVAELQVTALKYGITSTNRELTSQEKALASVWAVWEQTQNAWASGTVIVDGVEKSIGDMSKTLYSNANMIRLIQDQLGDLARYWGMAFQPIVNVVLPYIAALNKALIQLGTLFSTFVGKLFGFADMSDMLSSLGSSGSMYSESDASALDDLESDLSGVGDTATDTKNKLSNLTGGIDELNILSESDSSGGGSSGLGSGIENDIGVPDIDTIDPNAFSKIDEMAQSLIDTFKVFGEIDLSPLGDSFSNLFDSMSPVLGMAFDGFKYFITDIIKPLSQVVIEDILPSFLNLLAKAINFVTPAIEGALDTFKFLNENVIKPLSSFVGSLLVDGMDRLGATLETISPTLDIVVYLFGALLAIITVVKAALWLGSVATTAMTIATTLMTTATTALGGAMAFLTSKTTLVILAIIAIIAIGNLLVKNWDLIKEVAYNTIMSVGQFFIDLANGIADFANMAVDFIMSSFSNIVMWFKDNVIDPLLNAFSGFCDGMKEVAYNTIMSVGQFFIDLANGMVDFANMAVDFIMSSFSNIVMWFKGNVIDPLLNVFSGLWDGIKGMAAGAWEGILSLFSAGGKIFSGITGAIADVFKGIVNILINGINTVISIPFRTINTALSTLKSVSIVGLKPFSFLPTISAPEIPRLFTGGIAYGDTLARVGDYTNSNINPEVIAPLDKLKGILLETQQEQMVQIPQQESGEQNVITKVYLNGKEIFEQVDKYQKQKGYDLGLKF